jgi:hypothetical protein
MLQLYQDIVDGLFRVDPNWPYWPLELRRSHYPIDWPLSRHGDFERGRLIAALRRYWPERYDRLSDKTLSRYIGALLPTIWEGGEYLYRDFPT